jgi:hypothetical protein
LNRAVLLNKYWEYPVEYDAGHRDLVPVGRGLVGSDHCAEWRSFHVCNNLDGHAGKLLKVSRDDVGVDCTGKVIVKHDRRWCHKASCPICFDSGFAAREARAIEHRIERAVQGGMGKPEHVTVSVALADRHLPEPVFKKKCEEALRDRGVFGYCMIPHMYRINRERCCLEFSPHYHAIGFILGGFDRCRECVHDRDACACCDGTKGREVRGYAKDGYLVKVHDIRKSVFGTAKYALNHASMKVGFRAIGSRIVTWHGALSNRLFNSGKVKADVLCPACNEVMVHCGHAGKRYIIKDRNSPDYVPYFVDSEFGEGGVPNWPELGGG